MSLLPDSKGIGLFQKGQGRHFRIRFVCEFAQQNLHTPTTFEPHLSRSYFLAQNLAPFLHSPYGLSLSVAV